MDVEALRLFAEVARRGSFAAVARDRGAEPSTISRIIATLEQDLGFRLFQRTTRYNAPTEAGALYLQRVERLLEDLDGARDEALAINSGPMGTLRLAASVAFGTMMIVPLLPAFQQAYPGVGLDLLFSDATVDLVEERIDLAIRLAPSIESDVIGVKLRDTRYRVCAAPSYLARHARMGEPADLAVHRCLLFTLADYRTRWIFRDGAGEDQAVPIGGDLVFSSAIAIYHATKLGLGPALLPDWLIDGDLASGTLVDVFPTMRATATTFDTAAWMLYPSRSFLPNKVRVMIDFLKAKAGKR